MQQTSIFEAPEHPGRRDLPPRASQSSVRLGSIAVLLALGGLSGCSGGSTDGTPYFGREGTTSSTPSSAPASQSSAPPVINSGTSTAPTSASPSGTPPVVASPPPAASVAAPSPPVPSPAPTANESGPAPTNLAPAAAPPAKPASPPAAEKDDGEDDEQGDDHGGGQDGEGDDDEAPARSGSGNASSAPGATPPAVPPAAQTLSFERDVWPIFNAQCGPCHVSGRSGGHSIGSTNLDTAFADAVRVGRRITSELAAGDMPPACNGGNPGDRGCISSSSEVDTITAWLDQGSPR